MKLEKVKEMLKNVIILFIVLIIFKSFISYQLAKTEYLTYDYLVRNNDTIWTIAQHICSQNNKLNIRNVITDIKYINDIEKSTIYSGQIIKLPIY